MRPSEERKYEFLSPFELKNKLIELAENHQSKTKLNAGRGNPNWFAIEPRNAFVSLMRFALEESERHLIRERFARVPEKAGTMDRFKLFLTKHPEDKSSVFFEKMLGYIETELQLDSNECMFEMVDAILGDHYPTPDRMLSHCEKIVRKYIEQEMLGGLKSKGKIDLFATEGGTAAMGYIFNSLIENKLLKKGDKVALGTPIFTPYLEIPVLNDYRFIELKVQQGENLDWQYPDREIEKLEDPSVKAFFLVNPSNPSSVSVCEKTLKKIATLVKTKRKDLIILTDDVYGTFVNGFKSLMSVVPHNTILMYSFSKYFGATGWRLGVIGIHEKNIFDEHIAKLSLEDKNVLHKRYKTTVLKPEKMKFIDRMVADSRSVALHHTSGLSTPQQVQMALFALYGLIDKGNVYKKTAQEIIAHRYRLLYEAIGLPVVKDSYNAHYYTTIDIPKLAADRYNSAFAKWLIKSHESIDFVVRLAEEKSVVLMDGGGFAAPEMSVRVSLANLDEESYSTIGKSISELLEEYFQEYLNKKALC